VHDGTIVVRYVKRVDKLSRKFVEVSLKTWKENKIRYLNYLALLLASSSGFQSLPVKRPQEDHKGEKRPDARAQRARKH